MCADIEPRRNVSAGKGRLAEIAGYGLCVLAMVLLPVCEDDDKVEFTRFTAKDYETGQEFLAKCNDECSKCYRIGTIKVETDSFYCCTEDCGTDSAQYDCVDTSWKLIPNNGSTSAYCSCRGDDCTPPEPPDTGTVKIDDPPNRKEGQIFFAKAAGDNFGFDDCYDHPSFDQPSFLSIAAGEQTSFDVRIASPADYSVYVAVIHGDSNALSFDHAGDRYVSNTFSSYSNTLTIYAHKPTHKARISIFGISAKPDTVALIHDGTDVLPCEVCDVERTGEKPLEVIVYEERVLSPSDLRVYGSPLFDKTPSQIAEGFNAILKQAVVSVGAPDLQPLSRSEWDLNDNGRMDRFLTDLVDRPFEEDEFLAMIKAKGEHDYCQQEKRAAIFAVDAPIHWNYMLVEEPVPDSDGTVRTLVVDPLFGGELGPAKIGPFWDTTGHRSILITAGHLTGTITVCLASDSTQGLPDVYSVEDTITVYTEFTGNEADHSCACVHHDASWGSFVHELLHGPFMGGLEHPRMTGNPEFQNDNIMYPFTPPDRVGVTLRYRSIPVVPYGDLQSQWEEMHR